MHFLDKDGPPKHEKQVDSFQWIFSYFFLSLQEIPFFLDLRRWSLQNWPSYHNCALLCFAGFQNYWGLFTLELLKHIKLFLTEFPTLSYWDHWVLLRAAAPPGSCEPISVGDGTAARRGGRCALDAWMRRCERWLLAQVLLTVRW